MRSSTPRDPVTWDHDSVELQELATIAVITEARFPTTPKFTDIRGALVEGIMEEQKLPNWLLSDQAVQVFNENDSRAMFSVSASNMSASFEHLELSECRDRTADFLERTAISLQVEPVIFLGVRTISLAAASDFEELRDRMVECFSSNAQEVFEPFGRKPSDAGWGFEFRDSEPEHAVRIGPAKHGQAAMQLLRDRDPAKYPPQFLFLDIDRNYHREPIARDSLMERWSALFDRSLKLASSVGTVLQSKL